MASKNATWASNPGPGRPYAAALLGTCRGFLQADAYAGFNALYLTDPATETPRLVEVACWSHARRKLYEVHLATGSVAARESLERIATLFAVEAEIRGRVPPERRAARQSRSVPILDELKCVLDTSLARASAKSSLAPGAGPSYALPGQPPSGVPIGSRSGSMLRAV